MTRVALVVQSKDTPPDRIGPVVAALSVQGFTVHRVDVGRIREARGAVGRVVQALLGEVDGRRVERELEARAPDVAITFDPGATAVLVAARDRHLRAGTGAATPVVAVVADLAPGRRWAGDADRYLVVDDEAAVALSELGVDGARILPVGAPVTSARVEAGREDRRAVRRSFQLPEDGPVVLVDARGLSGELLSALLLQLSLLDRQAHFLFDAGDDAAIAGQLRSQVPTMGLRAKLFGETGDASRLWRAADVAIVRARPAPLAAAFAAGAAIVALEPSGDAEQAEASALAERGLGVVASRILLLSNAVEPLLGAAARREAAGRAARRGPPGGDDAAASIAVVVHDVAEDREAVLAETAAQAEVQAEAQAEARAQEREASSRGGAAAEAERVRRESAASGLEDLGGEPDDFPPPPAADATTERLRAELVAAEARAKQELESARGDAERWDQRRLVAEARGETSLAAEASREADRKRARMHAALEELARLGEQRARLEARGPAGTRAAPRPTGSTLDDLLDQLRSAARSEGKTIDDELTALKKRVEAEKKKGGNR